MNNVFNTTGYDIVTEAQISPNAAAGAANYDIVRAVGLTYPLTFGVELQARFH